VTGIPAWLVGCVVLCGLAGLLVPALVARIPQADRQADQQADLPPRPTYAEVAARPGLGWRSALAAAVSGGLVGAAVGLDWPLLPLLPLVPVGVALAVVDWHTHLLPTVLVWPTLGVVVALGALAAVLGDDLDAFVRALLGMLGVFAFFYLLWWVHPAGMGFGDVRLSAVLGFALGYVGWPELLLGIYGGFLAFSVPGLALTVVRRDRDLLRTAFPFGPFLLVGALGGLVLGGPLWSHLVAG
jgi:leader peptidase (prepilin peptidase)/N-methyltransferase